MVFPGGTAGVERSFSALKFIKNRVRKLLDDDTLENLLLIAVNGSNLGMEGLPTQLLRHIFDTYVGKNERRRLKYGTFADYERSRQFLLAV